MALALLAAVSSVPPMAAGATLGSAWRAKLGTGGANGTATIQAYTSGTGVITLKLGRLKPATYLPVSLHRGTCASVGAVLIRFPRIRSTSSGAAARTSSLTAAQVTLIGAATSGTGRIALRIGSATTGGVKCGLFAALPVPPVVTATITVGRLPTCVAITPSGVWVGSYYEGTLTRVDPATNSVLSTIDIGGTQNLAPWAMTFADGSLWVAVFEYDTTGQTRTGTSVQRIDTGSGQSLATVKLGTDVSDITASPGAVWVSSFDEGTVTRIDTSTNQVAATITLAKGLYGIAYDFGAIWVANEDAGNVARIDPATNQVVATIATMGSPTAVTTGAGSVWVTHFGTRGQPDGLLSRIDPATNQVARTIAVGVSPGAVAFGDGYVWVALFGEPVVIQVNPATNAVTARITTGPPVLDSSGAVVGLFDIAAAGRAVWAVQPVPPATLDGAPDPGRLVRLSY